MAVDYHIAVGFKGIAVSPLTFYSNSDDVRDNEGNFNFFDPFNKTDIFITGSEIAFYTIKELSAAESAALDSGFKEQNKKFISRSHSPLKE
jgi:hypothetical protein